MNKTENKESTQSVTFTAKEYQDSCLEDSNTLGTIGRIGEI